MQNVPRVLRNYLREKFLKNEGERCMSCPLAPLTSLQKDIVSESYQDLRKMVQGIVLLFHQRYGGDLDDLFSEANKLFLLAHARHDSTRGKLSTCVYHSIYRGLRDIQRRERKRLGERKEKQIKAHKEISLEVLINHMDNAEQARPDEFIEKNKDSLDNINSILCELEEDSKQIVNIILFPPEDFFFEVSEHNNPLDWKDTLQDYLRFQLKWNIERINKSFKELETVLNQDYIYCD